MSLMASIQYRFEVEVAQFLVNFIFAHAGLALGQFATAAQQRSTSRQRSGYCARRALCASLNALQAEGLGFMVGKADAVALQQPACLSILKTRLLIESPLVS